MENSEEILHSLEEFSKLKPKDIPRELEDYLCFVAKTGDPVYQWSTIKGLFREKLINVITEFYEACPSVEIPPCPNVEVFNYDSMKSFILEKLDTFAAAPFTVQRICELLTSPRKEYNRIDKYMRALEKNILVVSTTEPGNRRSTENGDGIVNGLESEHTPETNNANSDINVEEIEMDDGPTWPRVSTTDTLTYQATETNLNIDLQTSQVSETIQETFISESRTVDTACSSTLDTVITCRTTEQQPYVSIEPVASDSCSREESIQESDVTVTITAIPAAVQKRRDSIEPVVSSVDEHVPEKITEFITNNIEESKELLTKEETATAPVENLETALPPCEQSEPVESTDSIKEKLPESPEAVENEPASSDNTVVQISTTSDLLLDSVSPITPPKESPNQALAALEVENKESPTSSEEIASSSDETSEITTTASVSTELEPIEATPSDELEEAPKDALISSSDDEIRSDAVTSELNDDLAELNNAVPKNNAEEVSVTNSNLDDNLFLETNKPQIEQNPDITTDATDTVSNSNIETSMEVDTETEEYPQEQQHEIDN